MNWTPLFKPAEQHEAEVAVRLQRSARDGRVSYPVYHEDVIAFFCHLVYLSTVKQIIIVANYINPQEEETQ